MVAKTKPRIPTATMQDTKQCPVCKEWIVCKPGQREDLDRHIYGEHPDEFARQEEIGRKNRGDNGGSGRLPHVPIEPDPDEILYREERKKKRMAEAEAKPAREPKPAPEPHPCWCGCGETITTGANFKPGHDAKLKGAMIKKLAENPDIDFTRDSDIAQPVKDNLATLFKGRFASNVGKKNK